MNAPSPRKSVWLAIALIASAVAALACLAMAAYLFLPVLVSERLPVAQIQRLGFVDFQGRVSRIGLRQAAAGPFLFGPAERPAISIQSVELDYSLGELRRKKIRCVRIRDVTVNAMVGPDGIALPGLDTRLLAEAGPADPTSLDASASDLGLAFDKMEIRSGMVVLSWRKVTYRIPFEADFIPKGSDVSQVAVHVRLFPGDQRLALTAQADLENRKADLILDGPAIALDPFTGLLSHIPGLDVSGEAAVQARASLQLMPFAISDATANLAWRHGRLAYGSLLIASKEGGPPATLSAASADLNTWQISATGIDLQAPAPMSIHALAANLTLGGDAQSVAGKADLTFLPFSIACPQPVALKNKLGMALAININRQLSGDWTAEISSIETTGSTPADVLDVAVAGGHVRCEPPRFKLSAQSDGLKATARWQIDLKSIRAAAADTTIAMPSANGEGELTFNERPDEPGWTGHGRIQLSTSAIDGHGMSGKLENLVLSVRAQQQGSQSPIIDGRLRWADGRLQHKSSGLRLAGIRLELPYRSDPKAGGSGGAFSVDRVVHRERTLGGIHGRVAQKKDAFVFTATHSSDLFPNMIATMTGRIHTAGPQFADAAVAINVPSYQLPAEYDLGRIVPAMKGVTLSGMLSAKGTASLSPKGARGDLHLAMQDGQLRIAEKQIVLTGIDTSLHFPELPRIRSGPAQPFRFTQAAIGGIVADGGSFDVQVESPQTLFVEKGRLFWCGGKVDAQSLRVTAGKQDYQVSLYCQRLGLSRILEQLGSVNAKGSGTVNGRIPIVYNNGRIRFDDGFLFSTPGETGQIQLSGTEVLTRGIPAGTPQFAQVELAREALKDYEYKWAKLGMMSEGEDLVMRLQFDGKPAKPLPFIYKKELGSFVRVEAGAQGSHFQGISLDVNLRLPLNQLLQYKDIVKMIE